MRSSAAEYIHETRRHAAVFKMKKKIVLSKEAPKPIGPYSQAVMAGNLIFVSGQIAQDPETGELLAGGSPPSRNIQRQTAQCMRNLKAVLEAAGSSLDNVVKCTLLMSDLNEFALVNEEYAKWFRKNPPARTAIQVARIPRDAGIEIEAIAVVP